MRQFWTIPLRKFPTNSSIYTSHRSNHQRVVVTGMGIVCPLGVGVSHVWEKLLSGCVGTSSLIGEPYSSIPCKVAAYVPRGEKLGELDTKAFKSSELRTLSTATIYGLVASEEAITDAKWFAGNETECESTGVAVGTGMVDLQDVLNEGQTLFNAGYRKVSPYFVTRILGNMVAGHISMKYGFKGPNHCVTTACATGAHAIGDAFNFIRLNYAKMMVCGATEAVISPLAVAAFSRIKALSTNFNDVPTKASRPFDKLRDGFVMGEGSGILVLESLEHAIQRNAKIYAEIVGYGLSGDAHHIASPPPDGSGAYRSMLNAVKQSGFEPQDIGYVNAHATSTPLGDAAEITAIQKLFDEHTKNLMISSTKGATGHLLGAAGSIEAIFSIMAIHSRKVPPTANLDDPDVVSDIQLVSKQSRIWNDETRRVALTNSFGFGGTNASLVFASYDP